MCWCASVCVLMCMSVCALWASVRELVCITVRQCMCCCALVCVLM